MLSEEEIAVNLFTSAFRFCDWFKLDTEHMLDAAQIIHDEDLKENDEDAA